MQLFKLVPLFGPLVLLAGLCPAEHSSVSATNIQLESLNVLDLHNVAAEPVRYLGRSGIRIADNAPPSDGDISRIAIVKGASMENGTVEVSLTGDTKANAPPEFRGFVGIAFRVTGDAASYECFYLRPKNGRSEDQLQRNHSVQYVSVPGFPWEKLRQETPGKYESYVDLVPGAWTEVKIEFNGANARLYVNGAAQPALIVHDLKQPVRHGAVALWIGPGTIANFADLRIRR